MVCWATAVSVYHKGANYPPASWLLLWPVFGWPSVGTARAIWAGCHLAALLALALQSARAIKGLHPGLGPLLLVAPWSMPAITHAVSLGQTAVVVLPLAVGGILLAKDSRADWRRDPVAAALFNLALLKPSGTLGRYFAVLAIVPCRLRPALLTVGGYLLLTVGAAWFKPESLPVQIAAWLRRTERLGGRGYGSLQNALFELGRSDLFLPLEILTIAALGAWVWCSRRSDVWTLIGASALVARLWVYHRVYDDVLALLAVIAVARIALSYPGMRRGRAAAALLVLLVAILWTLSRGTTTVSGPASSTRPIWPPTSSRSSRLPVGPQRDGRDQRRARSNPTIALTPASTSPLPPDQLPQSGVCSSWLKNASTCRRSRASASGNNAAPMVACVAFSAR